MHEQNRKLHNRSPNVKVLVLGILGGNETPPFPIRYLIVPLRCLGIVHTSRSKGHVEGKSICKAKITPRKRTALTDRYLNMPYMNRRIWV
ncbi:hypothetical protein TNCV_2253781 [Trichonephila clavipes]|nr:hypothetical protein TNCV_2253781 [Trichonephila clavipes]